MNKIFSVVVVLALTMHGANAKFSQNECANITTCCAGFDNSDDSDEMEYTCCGGYSGDEFYACWDVCIRGESNEYCQIPQCQPGYGYNVGNGTCEKCNTGYYSQLKDFTNRNGESMYDYLCTECPNYTGQDEEVLPASKIPATSIENCYIPISRTWLFNDSTGAGHASFVNDCYYSRW
ncbi:MAG: hypothetical protein NC311_00745 [Muribaculaceae bacterium]|nr:hypothetical protein [Muribaculaceae bacterium]